MFDSNEYRLLASACRHGSTADIKKESFPEAINIDWNKVELLAANHRLSGLLYAYLKTTAIEAPAGLLSRLETVTISNAARNTFLSYKTSEILNLLREKGIRILPYKGPALTQAAYANVTLREFDDLDFLVDSSDMHKAVKTLTMNGYRLSKGLTNKSIMVGSRFFIDWRLDTADRSFTIDLHPLPAGFAMQSPGVTDRIFENQTTMSMDGNIITAPDIVDILILSCIHGTKHMWTRLIWLADIYNLLSRNPEKLDMETVFERSGNLNAKRAVLLSLSMCRAAIGLPRQLDQQLPSPDSTISALIAESADLINNGKHMVTPVKQLAWYHLRCMDNAAMQVRYVAAFLLHPTQTDIQNRQLPENLFFLYYLLRQLRLLGKILLPQSRP